MDKNQYEDRLVETIPLFSNGTKVKLPKDFSLLKFNSDLKQPSILVEAEKNKEKKLYVINKQIISDNNFLDTHAIKIKQRESSTMVGFTIEEKPTVWFLEPVDKNEPKIVTKEISFVPSKVRSPKHFTYFSSARRNKKELVHMYCQK